MAADYVDGLFGPSADEIRQSQADEMRKQALAFANLSPLERASMQMYQAGAGLVDTFAPAFGLKNTAVERANRLREVMGQGDEDLSTSAGMLAKAKRFADMGDQEMELRLSLKGQELRKQEAAALLAQQKQDEAEQFRRDQLIQMAENKKLELEQRAEAARLRSEDMRYSADQRRAAAAEAAQTRAMIATLAAETRRATGASGEKPMTEAQRTKYNKDRATSSSVIRTQDMDITNMGADIDKVMNDPALSSATGISAYVPSRPGSAASRIEGQLNSIENRLKAQGLKVLREGGGIGAITEKEWDILANQVANIDRKKGDAYVKGELEKVKLRMLDMQRNAAQKHFETFGEEYSPATPTAPKLPTPDAIAAERERRKGGK